MNIIDSVLGEVTSFIHLVVSVLSQDYQTTIWLYYAYEAEIDTLIQLLFFE